MRSLRLVGVFLIAMSTSVALAAPSPTLQKAADQCFGKVHVEWAGLVVACSEILKAKVKPAVKAGAYFNRGSAYLHLGGGPNALADFSEALKINPDFARALEARAGLLIGQGKIDLAMTDLNKAISLDGKSSVAFSNRGMAYMAKKDYSKALADFTKAVELEPSDAKSYSARGTAYMASGDAGRALTDLNKSLELDPKLTIALLNRGQLYASKGEKGKAKADFEAVLDIIPDNKEAKGALADLAKAGG